MTLSGNHIDHPKRKKCHRMSPARFGLPLYAVQGIKPAHEISFQRGLRNMLPPGTTIDLPAPWFETNDYCFFGDSCTEKRLLHNYSHDSCENPPEMTEVQSSREILGSRPRYSRRLKVTAIKSDPSVLVASFFGINT
ncbi:hypothetical protein MGYG_06357 [Nannizzia gypsea CBS 118893]|uniref:Uncharacterized protein n=1 Tax=Arthroderma gypseum (strain ATCC MYA-4604 / CBS 118893) TaxID=535722 RepID=E4UZ29_ARTGP|nr:hypothetical protein MGYG_06357 [Nannizzia gypsea CBS 118893]EFR03359.1 hypothetical protein MGYG_06357 [Nannizzia gypsea CBS 118893]